MHEKEKGLFEAFVAGKMSRRELLKATGKLGLSASAAGLLVTAAQTRAMAADFDRMKHKGTKLKLLLNKHPYADAMIANTETFKSMTGIDVTLDIFPMNVFPATVEVTAKSVTFRIDPKTALSYPVSEFPPNVIEAISSRKALSIGIRLHALHVGQGPTSGQVVTCQWLGDQTHVAVDVSGRMAVSVAHERINEKPGAMLSIGAAAKDLHLFDADGGMAFAHGGEDA